MILYVCVWYTYDIRIRRILARCFAVAWAKPNRSAVSLCGVTAPFGAGAGAERSTASGRWWLVVVRGWGWQDHLCKTGATELKSAWLHEWEMYRNVTCGYLWILVQHSWTFCNIPVAPRVCKARVCWSYPQWYLQQVKPTAGMAGLSPTQVEESEWSPISEILTLDKLDTAIDDNCKILCVSWDSLNSFPWALKFRSLFVVSRYLFVLYSFVVESLIPRRSWDSMAVVHVESIGTRRLNPGGRCRLLAWSGKARSDVDGVDGVDGADGVDGVD